MLEIMLLYVILEVCFFIFKNCLYMIFYLIIL